MNDHRPIRILIADDHVVVRKGIGAIIALQPDMELVGAASNGADALRLAESRAPDVILLDLVMPHLDGLTAIKRIREQNPGACILVFTGFAEDEYLLHAIQSGALGYLLKDAPVEQLLEAIRRVAAGESFIQPDIALRAVRQVEKPSDGAAAVTPLTPREMETLGLMAKGLANGEIADAMGIHETTVAKHVSRILCKLRVANRTQAALEAVRRGMVPLRPD